MNAAKQPAEIKLVDSELKVMNVIWRLGEPTAKQVAEILQSEIGWNINTTYTLIKRCIQKGAVQRQEPHFVCRPLVSKESVQAAETSNLINKIFDGSMEQLFAALLGRRTVSPEQISQLKRLVEEWPEENSNEN